MQLEQRAERIEITRWKIECGIIMEEDEAKLK